MNRQEYYRQKYKEQNPGWTDSVKLYKTIINGLVDSKTRILDIGCGHGDFMQDIYRKTSEVYGLDPDSRAIEKNQIIKKKTVGNAESLPYKENFFDMVVLAWVLEHLNAPERVFAEICRVLKPGGRVVFLTPNDNNYNVWLSRLIADAFHDFLTRRLYGRQEHDTYKAVYRVNTPKQIDKILQANGFEKEQLILNGDPSYISFNKILFKLSCFIEKLLNIKAFSFAKVHLIGVYRKK
ncbi:MAG: class I SAM-dependent methyltransferase [Patescibacteria group bacterium]